MKRSTLIILLLSFVFAPFAIAQDIQRLSEQEIDGTARYVGMCGAMTAIGGDPSAVRDNPAGLGVYQRMEFLLSLEDRYTCTQQVSSDLRYNCNRFGLPQASFVFAFPTNTDFASILSHNFMLGYHRVRSFNREYISCVSNEPYSLSDVACLKTQGVTSDYINNGAFWDDPELGWLSLQAWNTYLINPLEEGSDQWTSPLAQGEMVNTELHIKERGYVDEYNLDWAMNISDRLYMGVGLRIHAMNFTKEVNYTEKFELGGGLLNQSTLMINGLGVSGILGVLYHPIEWWRIGASFQTPSIGTVNCSNYGDLTTSLDSLRTSNTPSYSESISDIHLPLRLSVGTALQIPQIALLSVQYNYSHYKDRQDVHSFRAGLEIAPYRGLYINAGYAFESSFAQDVQPNVLSYNSTRTDTDFYHLQKQQYASFGIGYRGKSMIVQMAYQYGWSESQLFAHELATATQMNAQTHRVVVTLGWHSR